MSRSENVSTKPNQRRTSRMQQKNNRRKQHDNLSNERWLNSAAAQASPSINFDSWLSDTPEGANFETTVPISLAWRYVITHCNSLVEPRTVVVAKAKHSLAFSVCSFSLGLPLMFYSIRQLSSSFLLVEAHKSALLSRSDELLATKNCFECDVNKKDRRGGIYYRTYDDNSTGNVNCFKVLIKLNLSALASRQDAYRPLLDVIASKCAKQLWLPSLSKNVSRLTE